MGTQSMSLALAKAACVSVLGVRMLSMVSSPNPVVSRIVSVIRSELMLIWERPALSSVFALMLKERSLLS